jgi:hypothetical protein
VGTFRRPCQLAVLGGGRRGQPEDQASQGVGEAGITVGEAVGHEAPATPAVRRQKDIEGGAGGDLGHESSGAADDGLNPVSAGLGKDRRQLFQAGREIGGHGNPHLGGGRPVGRAEQQQHEKRKEGAQRHGHSPFPERWHRRCQDGKEGCLSRVQVWYFESKQTSGGTMP